LNEILTELPDFKHVIFREMRGLRKVLDNWPTCAFLNPQQWYCRIYEDDNISSHETHISRRCTCL